MNLEKVYILFWVKAFLLTIVIESTQGTTPQLSDELAKFCSKIDQVADSKSFNTELRRLLDHELKSKISKLAKKQNKDNPRGHHNIQTLPNRHVAVKSDDEVGQDGQLVRSFFIGTGESTGDYSITLALNQMNIKASESDVNTLLATIRAEIGALRKISSTQENRSSHNSIQQTRKRINPNYQCQRIIQSAYGRLNRMVDLGKISPHKKMGTSWNKSSRGLIFDEEKNSTLVDTELKIGPNGYSAQVVNIATEGASNSDSSQFIDENGHGNYQASRAHIVELVTRNEMN